MGGRECWDNGGVGDSPLVNEPEKLLDVWDGSRLPQEHEDLAVQKVEQLKSAIFEEAKLTFSNVYVPASF